MALTRTEMVTEICDVVGKSSSASAVSGALLQDRVVTYLNFGQKRLARMYSFRELNILATTPTTVTDVKRYPLLSTGGTNNLGLTRVKDISSIRLIDAEHSRVITRWHYRKFDKRFPRPENYSTGRPYIYIWWGTAIELFRVPNAAYSLSIRYPQWASPLNAANQISDFIDKDQLLITAGILETYLALEEYADAQVWYTRLLGQVKDATKAEGDTDWEPEAEAMAEARYSSGDPWLDPYGGEGDPLHGYAE